MKLCINFTQLVVLLSLLFTIGNGIAETQDENIKGRINFDFPDVSEAKIEINVSSKLFTLLTKSVEHEPEIGKLVAMIEGVYVRSYENGENLDQMLRHYENKLKVGEWEIIVKAKNEDEIVRVDLLFDEEIVSGVFIMVAGAKETILINIFGHIDFEKVGDVICNLENMNLNLDLPQLKDLKIDSEPSQPNEDI